MTGREYRHEKVKDPITGHHYWQTRKVELPPLDDERRMSLVADILGGKTTPEEVRKEYCLSSVNSIYTWIGVCKSIRFTIFAGCLVTADSPTTNMTIKLYLIVKRLFCESGGMPGRDAFIELLRSNEYVAELRNRGVSISMTQSGDPLENAVAERANGILKVEWLYKMTIATRTECKSTCKPSQ